MYCLGQSFVDYIITRPVMVLDLCAKFQPCTIYGFWIETEEQQQQREEELEKRSFFSISYVPHANFVILYANMYLRHSYPVVVKDVYSHRN